MLNALDVIEVLWPVFLAIGSFVVYKFIPYVQTKIFKTKYVNEEVTFLLVGYERIGSMVMQLLIILAIIRFGESTWEKLVPIEYAKSWLVVTIPYIVGIAIIISLQKKEGEKKFLKNIFLGGIVHSILSWQLFLMVIDSYDDTIDWFFYLSVCSMLFIQISENLEPRRIKNVKCLVYADKKKPYDTPYEPIKRGKYYYVRIVDKNKKEIKRIQIPEERIEKIEYIIENLEETKKV